MEWVHVPPKNRLLTPPQTPELDLTPLISLLPEEEQSAVKRRVEDATRELERRKQRSAEDRADRLEAQERREIVDRKLLEEKLIQRAKGRAAKRADTIRSEICGGMVEKEQEARQHDEEEAWGQEQPER